MAEQAYTGLQLAKEEPDLKLLMAEGEEVEVRAELPEAVTAPVEPGTVVGSVCYYLNGTGCPVLVPNKTMEVRYENQ